MPFDQRSEISPFNSLPPVVVVLALAMLAVEVVLTMAAEGLVGGPQGIGWRQQAFAMFSIWKPAMLPDLQAGLYPPELIWRFVSYPFIHGGFSQMLFPAVILLAMGKFVGEVYSGLALALTWALSGLVAGLVFMAIQDPASMVPLAGGMPPAYGLIGALTFILWQRARALGEPPVRAFRLIGFLLAFQLLFLVSFGGSWAFVAAELAGFAAGFGLGFVVGPGRWRRLVAQVRGR